jgi:hypothetical protein
MNPFRTGADALAALSVLVRAGRGSRQLLSAAGPLLDVAFGAF